MSARRNSGIDRENLAYRIFVIENLRYADQRRVQYVGPLVRTRRTSLPTLHFRPDIGEMHPDDFSALKYVRRWSLLEEQGVASDAARRRDGWRQRYRC
jgi:hypothetical protein